MAQYETLNNAAWTTGIDGLKPGTTEIWYARPEQGRAMRRGVEHIDDDILNALRNGHLRATHARLGTIAETDLEAIFHAMQGENWSPRGEARTLIEKSGLAHTSMSVGDIVVKDGTVYMVDSHGFCELAKPEPEHPGSEEFYAGYEDDARDDGTTTPRHEWPTAEDIS